MKRITHVIATFLSSVLLIGCAGGSSTNKEASSAPTTTPQQTARSEQHSLIQSDEKTAKNDFSSATNKQVTVGDYLFEVPSVWDDQYPYYYAEDEGGVAMLYMYYDDKTTSFDKDTLVETRDSFLEGMISEYENSEVISVDTITVKGVLMNGAIINVTINDNPVLMETYWMANESNNGVVALTFGQQNTTKYDHFDDFHKIVTSIKNTYQKPEQSSSLPIVEDKGTTEPKPENTPAIAHTPTTGESNALKSAKSYLNYSAFSYKGLIEQLEYEGFSNEEATYAADNCGANWKDQAVKTAKSYLKYTAFSYTGLIEQLEYEEYTHEEAVHGADNCGADWNEQAAKAAKSYLTYMSFSRSGLINQLLYEGFTREQAEYGVSQNGY